MKRPFLIGVAGGISSGKSTVCTTIVKELEKLNVEHKKSVLVISMDSFYRQLSGSQLKRAEVGDFNLDHPDSFDDELCYESLIKLLNRETIKLRIYDKKTYRSTGEHIVSSETIPDVIMIEGILVFYYPKIRELFHMKLFVDCDADIRLSRRVLRDMTEFSRSLDFILNYYQKYVKPTFEDFCLPTKKYAGKFTILQFTMKN
jgi:uridine kinase